MLQVRSSGRGQCLEHRGLQAAEPRERCCCHRQLLAAQLASSLPQLRGQGPNQGVVNGVRLPGQSPEQARQVLSREAPDFVLHLPGHGVHELGTLHVQLRKCPEPPAKVLRGQLPARDGAQDLFGGLRNKGPGVHTVLREGPSEVHDVHAAEFRHLPHRLHLHLPRPGLVPHAHRRGRPSDACQVPGREIAQRRTGACHYVVEGNPSVVLQLRRRPRRAREARGGELRNTRQDLGGQRLAELRACDLQPGEGPSR
mmetsp:Transcript_85974/g.277700  ORF Transcript_85974/g.277700 Transcript_85974/m.277700 type:complete len:255 (-) Transcript_85974:8-772(-)